MADQADNLGDITISIGVDLTGLADQLTQATAHVQAAGEAMGEAFRSIDLAGLNDTLARLTQAASGAAAPVNELGQAAHEAGQNIHEAQGSVSGMGDALVALGEALLVAEALREFAQAAIQASENVQKAQISLTALTGSVSEANTKIESMKALAMSDGLSFPALLTAQTRMTALGMSTEMSTGLLRLAADAAATMGESFDEVSTKITRLVESGSAMPRLLTSIGTSARALGEVMGVAADEVQAAFKILDEPTRGQVLQAAMIKTAGVAAEQATLLSNQLKILATSWDTVLEEIGPVLAQAFQPVIDLIKNEVLPAIKEAVEWFKQLPVPVQDFVVALGALAVAGGLAAASLGAVLLVLAPIDPIILGVGAAAVALGAGFTALVETSQPLRDALGNLGTAISDLLSKVLQLVSPAFPSMGTAATDLAEHLTNVVNGITDLVNGLERLLGYAADVSNFFNSLISPLQSLGGVMSQDAVEAEKLGAKLAFFGAIGGQAAIFLELLGKMNPPMQTGAASAQSLAKALQDAQLSATSFNDAWDAQVNSQLQSAAILKQNIEDQRAAAQAKADAEAAATQAIKDANEALKSTSEQMGQASKLADSMGEAVSKLPQDYEQFTATLGKGADWLNKTDQVIAGLEAKINKATADWAMFGASGTAAGDAVAAKMLLVIQKTQAAVDDMKDWKTAFGDIDTAFSALTPIVALTASEMKAVAAAAKDADDPLKSMLNQLPRAADAVGGMVPNTKAWDDAMKELGITSDDVFQRSLGKGLQDMDALFKTGLLSTQQLDEAWTGLASKFKNSAEAQQQILATLQQEGAPLQLQLQVEQNILAAQMKEAELHGADAQTILLIQERMTAIAAKQQTNNALAQEYVGIVRSIDSAWTDLSKGIADAMLSGQDFGKVMKSVLDNLLKQITEQIVGTAFKQLKQALLENGEAAKVFDKVFNAIFGVGGSVETGLQSASKSVEKFASGLEEDMANTSSAVASDSRMLQGEFKSLGDSIKSFQKTSTDAMQQTATSIQASSSNIVSQLNLISSAITAIAAIIGDVELAHANRLLDRIEENTRKIDTTMEGAGVAGWQALVEHLPSIDTTLQNLYPPIFNSEALLEGIAEDIHNALSYLQTIAEHSGDGGSGSGPRTTIVGGDQATHQTFNAPVTFAGGGGGYGGGYTSGGGGGSTTTNTTTTNLDTSGATQALSTLGDAVKAIAQTLLSANSDLTALNQVISSTNAAFSAFSGSLSSTNTALGNLGQTASRANSSQSQSQNQNQAAGQAATSLAQALSGIVSELDKLKTKFGDTYAKLEQVNSTLSETSVAFAQFSKNFTTDGQALHKAFAQLSTDTDALDRVLRTTSDNFVEITRIIMKSLADLASSLANYTSKVVETTSALDDFKRAIQDFKMVMDELHQTLTDVEDLLSQKVTKDLKDLHDATLVLIQSVTTESNAIDTCTTAIGKMTAGALAAAAALSSVGQSGSGGGGGPKKPPPDFIGSGLPDLSSHNLDLGDISLSSWNNRNLGLSDMTTAAGGAGAFSGSGIQLNVTVTAGAVVGQNGMNQLADTVAQATIQRLRGAGVR